MTALGDRASALYQLGWPKTARFFASLVSDLEARARSDKNLWRDVYSHPKPCAWGCRPGNRVYPNLMFACLKMLSHCLRKPQEFLGGRRMNFEGRIVHQGRIDR
jgi:hypothetical protein